MADSAVAPRRGESVVDTAGIPTLRFLRYLEQVSAQTNETIPDTEIDATSISLSVAAIGELTMRFEALEAEMGIIPAQAGRA